MLTMKLVDKVSFHEFAARLSQQRLIAGKIITGSLQGTLRIFCPRQPEYNADDLMLESKLDAPILAVAVGRFVS